MKIRDIGEFEQPPLEGEQVKKEQIEGTKLLVTAYRKLPSSYEGQENYVVVQAREGSEKGKLLTFTGGEAVLNSVERAAEHLPVWAVLKRVESKSRRGMKYWVLASAK